MIEILNQINQYIIVGAMFFAFFHFVYLYIKAYKKYAIAEDFTVKEFKRVKQEYTKNKLYYLKIMLKPFGVFILYIIGISCYAIMVIELGLVW